MGNKEQEWKYEDEIKERRVRKKWEECQKEGNIKERRIRGKGRRVERR
jgi:hypothetical protein